jgi:hypothetical protein
MPPPLFDAVLLAEESLAPELMLLFALLPVVAAAFASEEPVGEAVVLDDGPAPMVLVLLLFVPVEAPGLDDVLLDP